jgi:uncharacterized protein (UPF0332 family)
VSEEDIHALVRYRLEQADEALAAARLLAEAGMCRQAAGRAYYAAFYSVLALLAKRGLGTSKHAGVVALFDREFVKNGAFDRKFSKALHELFDLRQRADHREMFAVSQERAGEALAAAERFIAAVRAHLAVPPGP